MVTIAVAKRKGSNAVDVAEAVIATAKSCTHAGPEDVLLSISRDYGETANHKVNELVKHLSFAIVISWCCWPFRWAERVVYRFVSRADDLALTCCWTIFPVTPSTVSLCLR